MGNGKKKYVPPTRDELIELGKEGKLYAIEVVYRWFAEEKIWNARNLRGVEVRVVKENLFIGGLRFAVEPGHWRVVCPIDILTIDIYQQTGYFEEI